ncbi:hypothetical protein [Alkalimarinus alittae]|uniref:Uncharacterized protein n=1 Tax=Alkalimarinus alittae TaxID=2961619 RepID=A0ABY6N772_9ALTE|nr:hypothetical protein [Alkalimarinus alittae]UZE97834.1 hypothetical protein NKI27_08900 [Alkalimarinus alittae]
MKNKTTSIITKAKNNAFVGGSAVLCVSTLTALLSAGASADVKSLTSSELTETYIKDSTIIVTPKKKKQEAKKKTLGSITISPAEPEKSEEEELLEFEQAVYETEVQTTGAILNTEEQLRELAFSTTGPQIEALRPKVPDVDIPYTQRPDLDFIDLTQNFSYAPVGNDLGISRNEDQLTFSIGNLPGVNTINLPQGINEGPVLLVPRQGGGFDLTIDIPKN